MDIHHSKDIEQNSMNNLLEGEPIWVSVITCINQLQWPTNIPTWVWNLSKLFSIQEDLAGGFLLYIHKVQILHQEETAITWMVWPRIMQVIFKVTTYTGLDVATCGVASAIGFDPVATNFSLLIASLPLLYLLFIPKNLYINLSIIDEGISNLHFVFLWWKNIF